MKLRHLVADLEGRASHRSPGASIHAAWLGGSYGISFWKKIVRAALAVPDEVRTSGSARRKAGGDHIVAVDDDAGVGRVARPADAATVIGAPRPDVVEDHVVAVDFEAPVALPTCGPPMRKKTSESSVGSFGSLRSAPLSPCRCRPGAAPASSTAPASKIGAGDLDPRDVGDGHRDDAVLGVERRHPEPEHDRVGALDLDRLVDVVNAGREEQVPSARRARC